MTKGTAGTRFVARLATLIMVLVLAACSAVPPAAVVASVATNGVSYAATGKGMADHLISGATDLDCALHRRLKDQPACRTPQAEPTVAAAVTPPASPKSPKITTVPVPGVRAIMRMHTRAFLVANGG